MNVPARAPFFIQGPILIFFHEKKMNNNLNISKKKWLYENWRNFTSQHFTCYKNGNIWLQSSVHLFSEKIYKDNLRINNNRKFFFEINGFDVIVKVV